MGSYHDHDGIAMRWTDRALHGQQFGAARKGANLHDEGDSIYSYGHHFEVARILRDDRRRPVGWLLNGNRFSNTTNKHQSAVRNAIARNNGGLPSVTIPHAALAEAGIDLGTVQIIDVQRDWETETIITKTDNPGRWTYDYDTYDDQGGWQNSLTGEFVGKVYQWDSAGKPRTVCDHFEHPFWDHRTEKWEDYNRRKEDFEDHIRARHGAWEDVPASRRNTGRKRVVSGPNGRTDWDLVDDPDAPLGYIFERVQRRHWLGASLIRAAVIHQVNRTCPSCGGTGIGAERWIYDGGNGQGPLDREAMDRSLRHNEWLMERNGGIRQPHGWGVETYKRYDDCRACSRSGKVRRPRKRWAYYLSGFDQNETRPSYFFCELPPKSAPTTVAEAYEVLKPTSVKLAERMGRDVKRQGDIFAIPMPNAELRHLKQQGEYRRMPKRGEVNPRGGDTAGIPYLLDTNHAATEVVVVGGQTYARGMMTHAPAWRAPDHKRLKLGTTWHLVVKNTVPIGA